MPPHIQIGDISPRRQYTADGTQTVFTYPFPIFVAADLHVYVGNIKQNSGYVVTGAGISTGGSVTFTTAPAAADIVTFVRRIAIQRVSDFQESGAFRSQVINDELDYMTASLQQVADDQTRSVQMALTDPSNADMTLPSPQADSTLMWNPTATGFVNGPTAGQVSGAQASALNAQTSATNAAASETNAAASAAKLTGTSTTSVVIATGSKTLTTQSGKDFTVGRWLLITSDANPANYMSGQVTAYSGTGLTVNITSVGGSGTLADWTITVSGPRGTVGPTGAIGPVGADGFAPGSPFTDNGIGVSITLDGNGDAVIKHTMNGTTTIGAANLVAAKQYDFTVVLQQDVTGGRAVALPLGTTWPYGEIPIFPTAVNALCKFVLTTRDQGATWEASWIGANYA